MKYKIHPLNDGQELNYVETFSGPKFEAVCRATAMASQLARTLPQASIAVEVRTGKNGKLIFYGRVKKERGTLCIEELTAEMRL